MSKLIEGVGREGRNVFVQTNLVKHNLDNCPKFCFLPRQHEWQLWLVDLCVCCHLELATSDNIALTLLTAPIELWQE